MVLSLIFEIYRKLYGPIKAWIRAERLGARTCMACVDCRSGEHAAKHVGCSSALAGSYRTGRWHLRAAALGIRQSPHVWAGKHDVVVDPEGSGLLFFMFIRCDRAPRIDRTTGATMRPT